MFQEKWRRNLTLGNINILDSTYRLKQTDNKRELILDDNNFCVDTKPIKLNIFDFDDYNKALDTVLNYKTVDRLTEEDNLLLSKQEQIIVKSEVIRKDRNKRKI